MYVLHFEADRQGGLDLIVLKKFFPLTIFWLVRRIRTKRTQVVHQMRLRQFTPQQRILDVQTAPRKQKSDPVLISKHNDFYVRAWEREKGGHVADNNHHDNATIPNSLEIAV